MKKKKTPWPTKDAMTQIYKEHLWGGEEYEFYSGEGSHNPSITAPYLKAVGDFLKRFEIPLTVCDLGCGDFNIGYQLLPFCKEYHGVDIVENLIEHNKKICIDEKVTFHCLDISDAPLPKADCVLIRQVLQHVSNTEVQRVLDKLYSYTYVILTEHIPEGDFIPNKDIISGQGIRLKVKSGLDVTKNPFIFHFSSQEQLVNIPLQHNKGKIVTTLFKNIK